MFCTVSEEIRITDDRKPEKYGFDNIVKKFHSVISVFPDNRKGKNLTYSIEDAVAGAFSLFFTQNPSFPAYQKTIEKKNGKSNAQTLFGMKKIPVVVLFKLINQYYNSQ